jgi:hypothetical protein
MLIQYGESGKTSLGKGYSSILRSGIYYYGDGGRNTTQTTLQKSIPLPVSKHVQFMPEVLKNPHVPGRERNRESMKKGCSKLQRLVLAYLSQEIPKLKTL